MLIAGKDKARLAVFQHAGEFAGRLPVIEGNDDDAFGHERQIGGDPVDGIGSDEAAALAGRYPLRPEKAAGGLD